VDLRAVRGRDAALAVLGFVGYTTETRMSADLAKQQDQNKI